ncbi:MAG: RES family NAD+ phosphorylase [Maritimibacter sp.]
MKALLVSGIYWRMKFVKDAGDILGPARAPEGRSHYNGQRALYLSATPEGAAIATKIYLRAGDPERAIYPLEVTNARVVDLRDPAATAYFDIDVTHRAAQWQKIRTEGKPSPTWAISDRVRELGLDGMLYSSRTDPSKTHLTLFHWNEPGSARLAPAGQPVPFEPPHA